MSLLHKHIQFFVSLLTIFLSLCIYFFVITTISSSQTQIIRLEQLFALTAVFFLYVVFFGNALAAINRVASTHHLQKVNRSWITTTFYFGLLHGLLVFFGQLGGFAGLGFLSGTYVVAIMLSFTGLLILSLLTITSLDLIRKKLSSFQQRCLDGLLYMAGMLILIHAVMLGTHFHDLSSLIPQILFGGLAVLLLLEALRFDRFLTLRFSFSPQLGVSVVLVFAVLFGYIFIKLIPQETISSLGIHAQHIEIAKQAQQPTTIGTFDISKIPGMNGDRSRRFTLDIKHPDKIQPNSDVQLSFTIYEASNGNKVELFNTVYEKLMHLIVVNKDLTYFNHIHPEQEGNTFTITTQFPENGEYHLYTDFQPLGAIEQQFAFTLHVGDTNEIAQVSQDRTATKIFGAYEVRIAYPDPLQATQLSVGQQEITFTITDANTKQPVTSLKPYLGSFGHLVMIHTQTYEYLHVHPSSLIPPTSNERGGPDVRFMPLGIYGPIKPGTYKVFAQFNPDGKLFTADFIVDIL